MQMYAFYFTCKRLACYFVLNYSFNSCVPRETFYFVHRCGSVPRETISRAHTHNKNRAKLVQKMLNVSHSKNRAKVCDEMLNFW
jgi:hypothetical protein